MNEKPRPAVGSLIERAAASYDFDGLLKRPQAKVVLQEAPLDWPVKTSPTVVPTATPTGVAVAVNRQHLRDQGLIIPGATPTALSEEFRLIKRQLLLSALGSSTTKPVDRGQLILICSAQPNEGKTFCAVNLALSMASETDIEVVLVDADVAKPEMLSKLGLEGGRGLMDALADPSLDVESCIMRTDVPNLAVLPAGTQANNDTELLASERTRTLIDGLVTNRPRRIVLFDSAPALAASPASVLALHVGQTLFVVRADQTNEGELREALALVDACPEIRLMLNGVTFAGSNRKFGSYYGFGE